MKRIVLCMVLVACVTLVSAQTEIPSFGKIDPSELSKTDCDYDKDAEAEVLLDYANMTYIASSNLVTTEVQYRVRLKILKDKGLNRANITLPYYHEQNSESITKIEAYTYNADPSGQVVSTKLEKSSIYDKKVNKRWSEIVFSMPNVKVGSIIEYRYRKSSKGFDLNNWYFQQDIPVRYSCYNVAMPSYLRFIEDAHTYLPVDVKKKESAGASIVYKTYVMKNIPALRVEPYMSTPRDYLQKLAFRLVAIDIPGQPIHHVNSTWKQMGRILLEDEDFGSVIKKNINLPADIEQKLKTAGNEQEKLVIIHDFVRKNMTWDNKYSIWALDGIKKAWEKKAGNSGEINLILINLLKDAGLKVFPLMVSTRSNGRLNTFSPSLNQFDNVLAYVEVDSAYYVLDGTDKITPYTMIPQDVSFTEAMLVRSKEEINWVTLKPQKRYEINVFLQGDLSDDGFLKGKAVIRSYGYSRTDRLNQWKKGKEKFAETYFNNAYPNIKIEDFNLGNDSDDLKPLEQTVQFTLPTNSSGEYSYFTSNLFLGLEKNAFIAEKRFADIEFGYNQTYSFVGLFYIPKNYEVEQLPKNIRMIMPDTSISLLRVFDSTENQLNIRVVLDFKRPIFYVEEYEPFREFYKLLYETLNEQIVLRRKEE